jgi:hypothetical protein
MKTLDLEREYEARRAGLQVGRPHASRRLRFANEIELWAGRGRQAMESLETVIAYVAG